MGELTQRMAAAEERVWIAYYQQEPFGAVRADANNALIAQLIHNTNSKKARPMEDFMLFRKRPTSHKPDVTKQARQVFADFQALHSRMKK